MPMAQTDAPRLGRIQAAALIVGVLGLAGCAIGWYVEPAQFFSAYLFAWMYWLGIPLGAIATVALLHLVGGAWGLAIRRPLEAAMCTLPLLALLFVPLLFGMPYLYPWMRPEAAADPTIAHKLLYLNFDAFAVRAALYFAIWIVLGYLFNRWSLAQDRSDDPGPTRRLRGLSPPTLILYFLTVTFAVIDWVMSIQPTWYSTIFGALFVVGNGLVTLAFVIVVVALLARRPPLAGTLSANTFHDLGNLLLTFVIVWAYFSFSQLLIIWAGNLPEEIQFYTIRLQGGWTWVGIFMALCQFVLPFFVLLSRAAKRRSWALGTLAAGILLIHMVELFWLIMPSLRPTLAIHWLDLAAPLGIGGIWLAAFTWQLSRHPLLPMSQPQAREVFAHEGHEAPGRP
jgi:hypothetical protein